ncbi:MAG: hypothetical protein A4S09_16200 [Proteobacteria bacterium SG_bin7]|nr:MAG: hypothetical protein A4S09_16200 [Proteobacteria bacterium SG_bin7]
MKTLKCIKLFQIGIILTMMVAFNNCAKMEFSSTEPNSKTGGGEVQGVDNTKHCVKMNKLDDDPDASDVGSDNCDDNEVSDDAKENPQKYVEMCKAHMLMNVGASALDGGDLKNLAGNTIIRAKNLHVVDRVRGNLIIIGAAEDSKIDAMSFTEGNTIVCGMDIAEVNDHRGNLVVVDGNIGDLKNSDGNIVVIRGNIGGMSNVRGNVVLR